MKRLLGATALLLTAAMLAGCGGGALKNADASLTEAKSTEQNGGGFSVDHVVVNASVRKTGQYPESFVLYLSEGAGENIPELSASDFHMTGKAGMWGSEDTRDFSCEFEKVETDGAAITITPTDFPEKYFYVQTFQVTCDKDAGLSFTEEAISEVNTPVADDFETFRKEDGAAFDYHLFTPETTENMPVVVVFHGYGDTSNLLTYRTAVEWAEPENQKKRPCYVIAPVIDDQTYYTARASVFTPLKALLDQMVEEGKVDPSRIYVMGNSFGGMSSIEFAEGYPDTVKRVLALCPALNYSNTAMNQLEKIKDIPIWFAHAEHDNTIPVENSRNAVEKLKELGAKEVEFTEYSDEEMNAAGADSAPDSTYSYHHVELAVMEDDAYLDWLYNG